MRIDSARAVAARLLGSLACAGMLGGCASGPKIFTQQDPAADFATYRSYGFKPALGTDEQGYSSILSQLLKSAVSREMETRGYVQKEQPDLLINFHVSTREKVQATTSPAAGGYYGYRRGYYGVWGGYPMETNVTQYTEGTLNIDLVDARRNQLVWEGVAVGRIREEARRNLEPSVNEAVAKIFMEYPHRAAP
jgi:hypothetical protein